MENWSFLKFLRKTAGASQSLAGCVAGPKTYDRVFGRQLLQFCCTKLTNNCDSAAFWCKEWSATVGGFSPGDLEQEVETQAGGARGSSPAGSRGGHRS